MHLMYRFGPLSLMFVVIGVLVWVNCEYFNRFADFKVCLTVRNDFESRDFHSNFWRLTPAIDNSLRVCSNSTKSCCTNALERQFFHSGRKMFEQNLHESVNKLTELFKFRYRKFDEYFQFMLNSSKQDLHEMFKQSYGILYVQNSYVFTDFFQELEDYYYDGKSDLDVVLKEFFITLHQRMIAVFNQSQKFSPEFWECTRNIMHIVNPFGEIPKQLRNNLKSAFVSTRAFTQALRIGAEVSQNMLSINLTENCFKSLLKMQFCSGCSGISEFRACSNYCFNVIKGCLAYYVELNSIWANFINAIEKITDKLLKQHNIKNVIQPIDIRISDAIMNFQENGGKISNMTLEHCGHLIQNRTRRSTSKQVRKKFRKSLRKIKRSKQFRSGKAHKINSSKMLQRNGREFESLINETKIKISTEVKNFWSHLPYLLCNNQLSESPARDVTCWNGTDADRYLPQVVRDAFKEQKDNPSVDVNVQKSSKVLEEQIYLLKTISKILLNAYQGTNVDFSVLDYYSGNYSASEYIEDENESFENNWVTVEQTIELFNYSEQLRMLSSTLDNSVATSTYVQSGSGKLNVVRVSFVLMFLFSL